MAEQTMTIATFRRMVRELYPHVKVTVRAVDFTDLARVTKKCLTVSGDRDSIELSTINGWAKQAGIVPDGNLRFY